MKGGCLTKNRETYVRFAVAGPSHDLESNLQVGVMGGSEAWLPGPTRQALRGFKKSRLDSRNTLQLEL